MAVLPDDEPDFASALDALIETYTHLWETPNSEIIEALQTQIALIQAAVGTEAGFAPDGQIPSTTPDPLDPPLANTPVVLPPI